MNVKAGDELAGFPAIELREFFRKFRGGAIGVDGTAYYLGIGIRKAKKLLTDFENEGYLKSKISLYGRKKKTWWEQTPKGAGLRMASAAKPIKRAAADRLLSQLLERVEEVNESPDYLYKVVKVVLFGSYLDESRLTLSDIDIAVELERKEPDYEKHVEMNDAQVEKECRSYLSFLDHNYFSYNKVLKRLKNKSTGISLHGTYDSILKTGIPTKVVFPYENDE
jgi:predicted nucleotidyltransferase